MLRAIFYPHLPSLFLQSGVNMSYSIGLVIACFLILVSLWLPDVWKAGK